MSKEELDNNSNNIEHTYNEVETKKNLCMYELIRKLKKNQRKETMIKFLIFICLICLIGFLSLFLY
jgi:predicted nucleic acid-binding Zn ribbon protein